MPSRKELIEEILEALADGSDTVPPALVARLRAVGTNLCAEPDCHLRCGVSCHLLQWSS